MTKKVLIAAIIVFVIAIVIILYLHFKSPKPLNLAFIDSVKGSEDYKYQFGKKVIQVARKLGINPNALMAVMYNESRLNPKAVNPSSKATGLIQFIPSTANYLGTSIAEISAMTGIEQLDYVYKYLSAYQNKINEDADVYLAVFFPAALYQPNSWRFPDWAVKANKIFDVDRDGILTKKEFKKYFYDRYASNL